MLNSSVAKILERYRQCCYTSQASNINEQDTETVFPEILRLRATCESLQRTQRHFLGEDLGTLGVKELQKIEKQLDRTLALTRQRKTDLMVQQLEKLQKRAHALGEENEQLKYKLIEEEGQCVEAIREPGTVRSNIDHLRMMNPSPSAPNLQIGHHQFSLQDRASIETGVSLAAAGRINPNPAQGWP
ncbi:MADS-box transcription factor [Melia azedarach]|uniref:MADS-box transcription factor n=1 Tax=Melia azedarach TaxID=155640 RepID=A0ACC1X4N7_MELAZ|nr:MADS-box transcription factor [Melia azedarach]